MLYYKQPGAEQGVSGHDAVRQEADYQVCRWCAPGTREGDKYTGSVPWGWGGTSAPPPGTEFFLDRTSKHYPANAGIPRTLCGYLFI